MAREDEEVFESQTEINVARAERWLSVIAGSALAAYGLKRRSIPGLVLTAIGGALVWRGATGHCSIYELFGLSTAEEQGDQVSVPYGRGIRVEKTVTMNARPEDLYSFWRNFENLPRFMDHLESVTVEDDVHSHWVAKGPAHIDAAWDAEIINEIPNELIGWRSVNGSRIDNAGSVHFYPTRNGRGTRLKVVLRYDPPAGKAGAAFAKLLGEDPEVQVEEDLERLKQLVDSGALSPVRTSR